MRSLVGALIVLALSHPTAWAGSPWTPQPSGTTERLRGVSAVDDQVVWASGNHGTCLRTTDGGTTWTRSLVPEAANLDFRDVEGFDAATAYLLSIGPGSASRIFKTTNGGAKWVESYRNDDPKGFLDAIAFWDRDHGLALGDPVDGRFVILATDDGGKTWDQTSGPGTMPAALPGEGAFAASGTCLVVGPAGTAWFGTGGGATARVFRSVDRGRSWTAATTPIRAGQPSLGVFSVACRDGTNGVAVGGDYRSVADPTANLATTTDGGQTWAEVPPDRPRGFRSAVAYLPNQPAPTLLAVGPGGTDRSIGGSIWTGLAGGAEGWHALGISPTGRFAWVVGEAGRVGRGSVAALLTAP